GGSRQIVFDLPASINEGIGRVIMTHAILETQVTELLYELTEISYPAGRVAFGYRNARDRFSTIITLLDMHGIEPSVNVNKLRDQIGDCCAARDTFAHNVWLRRESTGEIGIRVTKGTMETPEGKMNFQFVPHGQALPDGYFESTVAAMRSTIAVVIDL